MKVIFTGKKLEHLEYNNFARANQLKLQVRVNVSVAKPNVVKNDSSILVRHTVMFGSPVDPFYLLVRHATSYQVMNAEGLETASEEEQKKVVNETCVPLATEKLNETLEDVCKGMGINSVQLPPTMANNPNEDFTQNN